MNYTPSSIKDRNLTERDLRDAFEISEASLVRSIKISGFKICGEKLQLITNASDRPLSIHTRKTMAFGNEKVNAIDYFRRVLEVGDKIDAVVLPSTDFEAPIASFWIKVVYTGKPKANLKFSKKDDGLFAMRAKSGEKAERIATRFLRDEFGHPFPEALCQSPGFFEIRYEGKQSRSPDRVCPKCGLTLEVKKRNRDQRFRVSHSSRRAFTSENDMEGWHAFVFPDMWPRFVPNYAIMREIESGRFHLGRDRYDSWADLTAIQPQRPPICTPDA